MLTNQFLGYTNSDKEQMYNPLSMSKFFCAYAAGSLDINAIKEGHRSMGVYWVKSGSLYFLDAFFKREEFRSQVTFVKLKRWSRKSKQRLIIGF